MPADPASIHPTPTHPHPPTWQTPPAHIPRAPLRPLPPSLHTPGCSAGCLRVWGLPCWAVPMGLRLPCTPHCPRCPTDTPDVYVNIVSLRTPRNRSPQGAAAGGQRIQRGLDRAWEPPSPKGCPPPPPPHSPPIWQGWGVSDALRSASHRKSPQWGYSILPPRFLSSCGAFLPPSTHPWGQPVPPDPQHGPTAGAAPGRGALHGPMAPPALRGSRRALLCPHFPLHTVAAPPAVGGLGPILAQPHWGAALSAPPAEHGAVGGRGWF